MKKTFLPWDVNQGNLFPPAPKDLVPPDHLSQFIRDLVCDELDLSAIYAHYQELRGYPPYHGRASSRPEVLDRQIPIPASGGYDRPKDGAPHTPGHDDRVVASRLLSRGLLFAAAVDSEHQVIVAVGVPNKQSDLANW